MNGMKDVPATLPTNQGATSVAPAPTPNDLAKPMSK